MNLIALGMLVMLQAQFATVEGIVTRPGAIEPLGGARVVLNAVTRTPQGAPLQFVTFTDEDGAFSFPEVTAGNYSLLVGSSRYGTVNYGQRRPGGPGLTLSLNAGQRLTNVRISMTPAGAIAGRISARNGEPVVGASVQAYQYSYQSGKRTLRPVRTTTTNDLGEYRMFQLPPGRYFVSATMTSSPYSSGHSIASGMPMPTGDTRVRPAVLSGVLPAELSFLLGTIETGPGATRVLEDGSIQDESWIPVFYPGTTDPARATPVDVSPDATMNGLSFAISPSPVLKVSGRVSGPVGILPTVRLISPSSALIQRTATMVMENQTTYRFEFRGVSPGSYTIIVDERRSAHVAAPVSVEVADRDVDNINIGLTPGIVLAGRIVGDTSSEARGANPLSGTLITLSQGDIELPRVTLQLNPLTGEFLATNVIPGTYHLEVLSTGWYLKSARLGQADATNGVTITGTLQDRLEVVLTQQSGALEGEVTDPRRGTTASSTVVLVPAVARRNASLYNATIADVTGRFQFQGIPAGDYLLFAWEDVENGAWQDPDFLRQFESRGQPVKITESSRQEVRIAMIPAP